MRMTLAFCTMLLVLPAVAQADEPQCKASEPRELKLDLAGVKSVLFEVNHHDLHVQGGPGGAGSLSGRACASSQERLKQLTVTQRKSGDQLIVTLARKTDGFWIGNTYAYLDIRASIPATLPVRLDVGSGDAEATGIAALAVDTGSGDVKGRDIKGAVTAKTGSGDIQLERIGALTVSSIGSGDFRATRINGAVDVGVVGSGDLDLAEVAGNVHIGSVGSGDVDVRGAQGSVVVDSIGSGDLTVRDVSGDLTVKRKGSGDVSHSGVRGKTSVPKED
ncbi:DUF4097 family beta strand repeat-containing protein [Stenotrophomonas sp. HITSZ_GD]|uniref:DUF4097 family beta strand repeat-containing protein n=1 Tax=Stenotrophomonas sp. HITSZ_GD TaxID=3037248 RepID=UPI00240DB172|nr:DUF4097 family beta strand repeat-containing protein [Stenotrophomonas sp. HITSZ_GD]MDG2526411.1 DUF4097 family beta strand repeat-containing protein [Stenotrophomonas sp. HITSZ_GD]